MTLEKAYFSCFGALVWVNWGFPLSLEKAEKLPCWKSLAARFYSALSLLSVTSKMNSSWGFAWKLISSFFCSCNLPLVQDQNPLAVLVPTPRHCPLQFNSRGCCGPVVAQGSARERKKRGLKEPLLVQLAWKKASNHLVPLLLRRPCPWIVGSSAVSQNASRESRDGVWPSGRDLSFVFLSFKPSLIK